MFKQFKHMKRSSIISIIDLAVVLIVSYCIITYTRGMKENPSCSQIKPNQREFLAYGGVLMLSHVILTLFLRGVGIGRS